MTAAEKAVIGLRPIATPLPLGFLALAVTTTVFSAVQLGWVPTMQVSVAAWTALLFAVPLQAIAAVLGFLGRDPIAGTGMGLLAGIWGVAGVMNLVTPAGSDSAGLGVVLLAAAFTLLVPAIAGVEKPIAAAVMATSAVRFATTGVAEFTGSDAWSVAAGLVGLVLAALAAYAALAFELEAARGRDVLPLFRRGQAEEAMSGGQAAQVADVEHEAGVRQQL